MASTSARAARSTSSCAQLADRGFAVLVLSSDVEEVAGLSDRSLVLDRGRFAGRFERGASTLRFMAATANDPAFRRY